VVDFVLLALPPFTWLEWLVPSLLSRAWYAMGTNARGKSGLGQLKPGTGGRAGASTCSGVATWFCVPF